ncbi:MAG: class I SAM-dependent RNA methyltransferase [Lachnospiraceae bacterium]|nr:class I SAM-dependent RNA methyltransferase [Lachnospiraceae bacterium]
MRGLELTATCHFGLEAVLKREIYDLGYDVTSVSDGRVEFSGDEEAVARADIFLRSAERILIKVGSFHAETFDELFEGTKALDWESFLPRDARFWVKKASSVRSKLFSPSDIQSIVKKAIVDRLSGIYHIQRFPETGAEYPLRVFLLKDEVFIGLDTTGESLHKRGYRKMQGEAPIAENLAAALILLTPWKRGRILVDPFAGSGTIPIEAAMIAANLAPGRNRSFTAQNWEELISPSVWKEAFEEASSLELSGAESDIQGYDIDSSVLKVARQNAERAGVGKWIHFQERDMRALSHPKKYGFIITNPPYGERMEDKKNLPVLYTDFGHALDRLDTWSVYLISSFDGTEKYLNRKAAKKRKIYNGMIRADYYQFPGPRP